MFGQRGTSDGQQCASGWQQPAAGIAAASGVTPAASAAAPLGDGPTDLRGHAASAAYGSQANFDARAATTPAVAPNVRGRVDVTTAYNAITSQQKVNLMNPNLSRVYAAAEGLTATTAAATPTCDRIADDVPGRDSRMG